MTSTHLERVHERRHTVVARQLPQPWQLRLLREGAAHHGHQPGGHLAVSGGRHYAPGCGGGRWPAVPILAADVVKVVVRPHLQETRVDRRRRSVWVEGEARPHRADQPHLVPPRQRDDALDVPAAVHLCTAILYLYYYYLF